MTRRFGLRQIAFALALSLATSSHAVFARAARAARADDPQHSGFFPGYATEMIYVPSSRVALGIQVDTSDPYPCGLVRFPWEAARVAAAP